MAKFLFVVPPFWGHINPTLTLGTALHKLGHTVAWASMISLDHLIPENATCYLFKATTGGDDLGVTDFEEIKKKGENTFGLQSIQYLYKEVLIPIGRYMSTFLPDIIEDFKPDMIVNDHQAFAGAIYAIKYNIPYVTSITAPAAIKVSVNFPQFEAWENEHIIELQKELGVLNSGSVAVSELMSLVFSSKEFLGMPNPNERYKFVGPLIGDRPTDADFNWVRFKEFNNPKVLISIGTVFSTSSKEDFYKKVVEAFADTAYTIILVADPDLFSSWPDNFIVQSRVPQLELLPHMDAVICHAGHNTVCESLANGLPLVVLPIAFDQSQVANMVTDLGCGIRLKSKRLKPYQLVKALEIILQTDSYKNISKQIGDSFSKAGGIPTAIKELEAALQTTTSNVTI